MFSEVACAVVSWLIYSHVLFWARTGPFPWFVRTNGEGGPPTKLSISLAFLDNSFRNQRFPQGRVVLYSAEDGRFFEFHFLFNNGIILLASVFFVCRGGVELSFPWHSLERNIKHQIVVIVASVRIFPTNQTLEKDAVEKHKWALNGLLVRTHLVNPINVTS